MKRLALSLLTGVLALTCTLSAEANGPRLFVPGAYVQQQAIYAPQALAATCLPQQLPCAGQALFAPPAIYAQPAAVFRQQAVYQQQAIYGQQLLAPSYGYGSAAFVGGRVFVPRLAVPRLLAPRVLAPRLFAPRFGVFTPRAAVVIR